MAALSMAETVPLNFTKFLIGEKKKKRKKNEFNLCRKICDQKLKC